MTYDAAPREAVQDTGIRILITRYAHLDEVAEAAQLGVSEVVEKPFVLASLSGALVRMMHEDVARQAGDAANGAPHGPRSGRMSRQGRFTRCAPDGRISRRRPDREEAVGLFAAAGPARRARAS